MSRHQLHQRWARRFHSPASATAAGKIAAKILLPLLALWYGVLMFLPSARSGTGFSFAHESSSNSSNANNNNNNKSGSPLLRTGSSSISVAPQVPTSPFFENVLEWKEIPLAEAPSNYDGHSSSSSSSNHYTASIEFCSDPAKNLYGYGPVGNCVPGGHTSPLIRIQPKHFYHLTLQNNAHIDTNLHTHGLHVSGVGTVDDVTRVAKPGECLTYDVSEFRKRIRIMNNDCIIHCTVLYFTSLHLSPYLVSHRKRIQIPIVPFFSFYYYYFCCCCCYLPLLLYSELSLFQ